MAVAENGIQVTWSASNDTEITDTDSPPEATSDDVDFSATAFAAHITCKANATTGSPDADDLVTFYVKYSAGNPDGSESEGTNDEFDDDDSATKLCTLSPSLTNPAIKTVPINPIYRAKIFVVYTVGGTAHYTVSAQIREKTA